MLLHHHNPFHAMESCLQLNGISLTPSLLHQTLIRLRHSSKIALSLFHYSLSLPSSPATSAAYNLMIDILAKVHQFDVCWQLIIQMGQQNDEDSDSQPNFTTFSVLIRRLIADRIHPPSDSRVRRYARVHWVDGFDPFLLPARHQP
ncbi:unnamed protein product [Linum trigynum]|uniref:Pentatricopeptide repeat-containing protein n=1 Tax=Linum trigynum TaxID=586398 RepID=A0AAV2DIV1_9ROSI